MGSFCLSRSKITSEGPSGAMPRLLLWCSLRGSQMYLRFVPKLAFPYGHQSIPGEAESSRRSRSVPPARGWPRLGPHRREPDTDCLPLLVGNDTELPVVGLCQTSATEPSPLAVPLNTL